MTKNTNFLGLLAGIVAFATIVSAQSGCTFTGKDEDSYYHWDLSSIALPAGQGYNITARFNETAKAENLNVNLCNAAYCPCVTEASSICDCDNTGSPDWATLSTRRASPVLNSYGASLLLHYTVQRSGAVHQTSVFLECDATEFGLRLLYANTRGDGHGGVAFGFATRAACGKRGPAPAPEHSCAVYGCNSAYNPEHPCQCDSTCEGYRDCCPDYTAKCHEGASCAAYGCGGYVPGRACQCDERCGQYDDCCSDFQKTCHSSVASCANYGCNSGYNREHQCQCDSTCKEYGDCCSDYNSRCGGV